MQPHEERVVIEKQELDEKLAKLAVFSQGNSIYKELPNEDRELLESQYLVMEQYSKILGQRIARFK